MITRKNLYIYKKIILEINYLEDQYLGDQYFGDHYLGDQYLRDQYIGYQYLDLQRQVINSTLEPIANDQFFI